MADTVERFRPDLLELAAEAVGEDPFARVGDGTHFDQPALYCAALAALERAERPEADLYAGHSLGEITALAAAGAVDEKDGLRLVAERGRLMEEIGAQTNGAMLAFRSGREDAEPVAERHGLTLANDNSPDQVVLSGPLEGIEAAEAEAQETGIRVKRLPIAGAFHSPLMEDAVEPFLSFLHEIEFSEPRAPVYSCVTAAPFDDVPKRLSEALVRPVRWVEVLHALHDAGGRRFQETGPGKVLVGLVRRTLEDVEAGVAEPAGAADG